MTRQVLNAFESVRPRGEPAAPMPVTLRHGKGRGIRLPGSTVPGATAPQADGNRRVRDVNGRLMATLAPRSYGSIRVMGRAQSQAQNDKTRAIERGGI